MYSDSLLPDHDSDGDREWHEHWRLYSLSANEGSWSVAHGDVRLRVGMRCARRLFFWRLLGTAIAPSRGPLGQRARRYSPGGVGFCGIASMVSPTNHGVVHRARSAMISSSKLW